jgi:succinate dehydrogenase/fumarate reductase flavoprotein subunit
VIAAAAEGGEVRILEVADPGLLGGNRNGTSAPSAVAGRTAADAASTALRSADVSPEDVELSAVVHARQRHPPPGTDDRAGARC